MISNNCIWSTCTYENNSFKALCYIHSVNLCDFRAGSYVILGTKATPSNFKLESPCPKHAVYQISMHSGQCFVRGICFSDPPNFPYCSLFFISHIHVRLCKMKRPLVGHFRADFICMRKVYKPCLQDAAKEIPLYLDYWFTRRRALNVFP